MFLLKFHFRWTDWMEERLDKTSQNALLAAVIRLPTAASKDVVVLN
jgi:hypothetical protein